MKNKLSWILVGITFLLISCENTDTISTGEEQLIAENQPVNTLQISSKKGIGMSTATKNGVWWQNINNLQTHWYYTWGTFIPEDLQANAPQDSEFIPMVWNGAAVTDANIARLNTLYQEGKISYLLGFNEPDLAEEANMTVEEALDKWQYLCERINPGIKLISPVTSYPSLRETSWMVRFMEGVQARNLRVDYMAAHIYQPNSTTLFTNQLQAVYERWGKKVWLTEFGVRDENTGGNPANNRYSREQILAFMQELLPQLDTMEAVERYAWFNASPTMSGLWPCGLVNADGTLTIVGEYYRNFGVNEDRSFAGGNGSLQNPYLVSNASQFYNIREYTDKHFKLTAHMDLTTSVPAWTPIPSFAGSIDGNNNQIKGLKYNSTDKKGGLIISNTGNIKNIIFPDVDVVATSSFGLLVGDHTTGTIDNIVLRGKLVSNNTGDLLGGVVGEISGGQISNVYTNLAIETTCGMTGGIAGRTKGGASTILNCATEGTLTVKASKTRIGGIVGRGESAVAIRNCTSSMRIHSTVTGTNGVGGIFGANNNDNMLIEECMFTGSLSNVFMCGGIAGVGANIRNCLVEGNGSSLTAPLVSVGGTINTSSAGGICGTGKGIIENCIVRHAAFTGVNSATLPIAGISSTFQNNGHVSKCVVWNVLLNASYAHGIAGTVADGTGAHNDNYVSEIQYYENGVPSLYTPDDHKNRLDGAGKAPADLYQRFYRARDFDMETIWKWENDGPMLVNVGYKGNIAL